MATTTAPPAAELDLPWRDLLRVYAAGDKRMTNDTVGAVRAVVDALEAAVLASDDGTVEALQTAADRLAPAIWASKMLTTSMEENLRRVTRLLGEMGSGDDKPRRGWLRGGRGQHRST